MASAGPAELAEHASLRRVPVVMEPNADAILRMLDAVPQPA